MEILYFEIDGYKNIENVHIDLNDITTLMSLNSKGKSNLLKGVLFGLLMINSLPDNRNAFYRSFNNLSKPLVDNRKNQDYRFEVGAKTNLENEEVTVFYSFTMKWDQKVATIASENIQVQYSYAQRPITLYVRNGMEAKYKSTKARGVDNVVNLNNPFDMFNTV